MKAYYNQQKISSSLQHFFTKFFSLSKPHLKLISFIITSMICAESVVTSDIFGKLKDDFSLVYLASIERRFRHFFNSFSSIAYSFFEPSLNTLFPISPLSTLIISSIFLLITCFAKTNLLFFFSPFVLVNNGIPIWFRCFKGKHNPDAYYSWRWLL